MNRFSMTLLAMREFGTGAAVSYFFKKQWPAMSSTSRSPVRYLHALGERVLSFETFEKRGETILLLTSTSRSHCRKLERVLRDYNNFESRFWNRDENALPVKVNTNYRCFRLYLPSSRCMFMNSLFD